jgi:DNA topoisomerase-6 subunit B
MNHTLERTTFETSRLLEFFTEKELAMQIGVSREAWPTALLKELIDNALDACENAGIAPEIEITIEADSVSVRDNGPGLPVETFKKSLDYLVRVSDKNHYISPTRGQLGNALKCVWAAPFVIDGEQGRVEVVTGGDIHRVDVTLDRIAQQPSLAHSIHPDGLVKNGTLVKMHWLEIACYLDGSKNHSFYKPTPTAFDLVRGYSLFNPHAAFTLRYLDQEPVTYQAIDPDYTKWKPSSPTSPHWYDAEQLRALIAAYVNNERSGGEARTVRAFVSEFAGLSSTAKQKKVTEALSLSGAYLHDLIRGDDIDLAIVTDLLAAMRDESRPIKPKALGGLGKDNVTRWLAQYCEPDSIRYKTIADNDNQDMPFVLELAMAYHANTEAQRDMFIGLNWTPALGVPFDTLSTLLGEYRIDRQDPVILALHLACPRLDFTDRGKSRLDL